MGSRKNGADSITRRRFLGLVGAGATATVLAACQQSSGASAPTTKPAESGKPAAQATEPSAAQPVAKSAPAQQSGGSVTLRVLTPSFPQDSGRKVFEEITGAFQEKSPNVKFEVEYLPNYNNLNERLSTNFAAGTPPDVFGIGLGWIEAFAAKNQLAPIDDLLDKAELDDFYPVLREGGSYGGKLYALPIQFDTRLLLYRKDHFAEAGLDPEKPPTSWEQLVDHANKLTKRNSDGTLEQAGFDIFGGQSTSPRQHFFRFFWQNGARLFDDKNSEALFGSPEGVEALSWYVDLIQKHKVHDLDFITGQPGITLLATGKASIASAHNEIWRELQQNPDNAKQVGVIPPIKRKASGEFIGGNFVVMARQTKHPEESWKFLEHLSSKDMTLKGDIARGAVPPRKSLQQSDYVKNNPILVAAMDQLSVAQREGGPERWLEIRSLWDPALVEALQAQKSPEQALRDLTEKSNEILKRA